MRYQAILLFPRSRGQLLLELLVVIAISVVIVAIGAQLVYVSLKGNKASGEKNVALGLKEEELEAVRNAATADWQSVYGLAKGSSTAYYAEKSSGAWRVATGTESVRVNDVAYSRSFTVQNVCRDASSRAITGVTDADGSATTCAGSGGNQDPSTEQVTVQISWPDAAPLSSADYLTRWRNKACAQSSWASQSSATSSCPATTYASSTNITTGANLQLCTGGC